MTETEQLAEMCRQYPHATLEAHMLDEDGKVRLRCQRCKVRPIPPHWQHLMWCDPCLDEANEARQTP